MSTKKQDLGKSATVQHWTGREIEKSQAPDNINKYEKKKKQQATFEYNDYRNTYKSMLT